MARMYRMSDVPAAPLKQAVAIAYSVAGKSRKKK